MNGCIVPQRFFRSWSISGDTGKQQLTCDCSQETRASKLAHHARFVHRCIRARIALAGLVVLLSGGFAFAYDINDVLIESWAGSGDGEVLFVVDFWPYDGQDDSFAFGYRFDELSITGLDLLYDLHADDNGLTFAESGGFVTDIWYTTGSTTYHTEASWPDSWWGYHLSEDLGESWQFASTGPADRMLYSGDTDGWVGLPGDDWTSTPVTPLVPEPASLILVAMGATAILRPRR